MAEASKIVFVKLGFALISRVDMILEILGEEVAKRVLEAEEASPFTERNGYFNVYFYFAHHLLLKSPL